MSLEGLANVEYASLTGKIHTIVVDKTLTISGACADAKSTGDKIEIFEAKIEEAKEAAEKIDGFEERIEQAEAICVEVQTGNFMRSEILNAGTKAMFGLTDEGVPNEVFEFLGKHNQHWWSKYSDESYYEMRIGAYGNKTIYFSSDSTKQITYEYSDNIQMSEDGVLSLVEPIYTEQTSSYGFTWDELSEVRGKYVKIPDMPNIKYKFIRVAEDAEFSRSVDSEDDEYRGIVKGAAEVLPVFCGAGTTEYVCSNERNAYPDDAEQDGFEYKYLGIPFENAVAANIRTAFGSYVGTGTYGNSNVNTITLPFKPKMVVVASAAGVGGFPWVNGMTEGLCSSTSLSTASATLTWSDVGVSWYSASAVKQLNEKDTTYYYFVIG